MPRIPIIDSPDAQLTPLPAPQAPTPPAGAFGGAKGAALEGLGEEAGRLATDAYHLAVRQQATEAENSALDKMIKLRSDYVAKFGKDATDAHPQTLDAMNKIYEDAKNSIPSKSGQLLFESNAMRNKRIELSVIETHFASQRKAYRVQTYKNAVGLATGDLANLATLDKDPTSTASVLGAASVKIEDLKGKIEQEAEDRGVDPADREAFVRRELSGPASAFINALAKVKHPALDAAFKQYGGLMQHGPQAGVYRVMNEIEINQKVGRIMADLPRIDADRAEDAHGFIPEEALTAQIAGIPQDDPNRKAIVAEAEKEVSRENARFEKAGTQQEAIVDRLGQGRGNGGKWGVPRDTDDWQNFERLYPARAKVMEAKEEAQGRARIRADYETEKHANLRARGTALEKVESYGLDELKDQTPETVASLVRTYSPNATGNEIEPVWKRVQELRDGKADPVVKAMHGVVKDGLKEAFGKDTATQTKLGPDARAYVEDLYARDKTLKVEDLKKALVTNARTLAADSGWFDRKSALEGYKDRRSPPKASAQKPDFEWDPVKKKLVPAGGP